VSRPGAYFIPLFCGLQTGGKALVALGLHAGVALGSPWIPACVTLAVCAGLLVAASVAVGRGWAGRAVSLEERGVLDARIVIPAGARPAARAGGPRAPGRTTTSRRS
jgi:hypothetical protein